MLTDYRLLEQMSLPVLLYRPSSVPDTYRSRSSTHPILFPLLTFPIYLSLHFSYLWTTLHTWRLVVVSCSYVVLLISLLTLPALNKRNLQLHLKLPASHLLSKLIDLLRSCGDTDIMAAPPKVSIDDLSGKFVMVSHILELLLYSVLYVAM